jgi:hypothetical protein
MSSALSTAIPREIVFFGPKRPARRLQFVRRGNQVDEVFRNGMRTLGYVEGRDYVLEVRWGRGDPERTNFVLHNFTVPS